MLRYDGCLSLRRWRLELDDESKPSGTVVPLNTLKKLGVRFYDGYSLARKAAPVVETPVAIGGEIRMRGTIGAYTYIRAGGRLAGVRSIGRYCSIAPGVVIGDGNHPTDWLSTNPFQWGDTLNFDGATNREFAALTPVRSTDRLVTVGHDVWIGAGATILRNVDLGTGSIVAAGSVVTRSVPPYAIVAGIPARVVRYRFDDAVVEKLQALAWWRYNALDLKGIDFRTIARAIAEIEERAAAGTLTPWTPDRWRLTAAGAESLPPLALKAPAKAVRPPEPEEPAEPASSAEPSQRVEPADASPPLTRPLASAAR